MKSRKSRIHWTAHASAAGALFEAYPDDEVVFIGDPLLDGPVSPLTSHATLAEWLTERSAWLDAEFGGPSDVDRAGVTARFCEAFDRLDAFDEVVVWVGEAVGSQLFFCWAAFVVERWDRGLGRVRVGTPAHFPNQSNPLALVGCRAREFVGGRVRKPSDTQLEMAIQIWASFSSSTPEDWSKLFDSAAELELFSAVPAVLERFPDCQTGLSLWETLLLQEVGESETSASWIVGEVIGKTWDYSQEAVGDLVLFNRLLELSCPSKDGRLLERQSAESRMRSTYALTNAGRSVRAGMSNRVDSMGIDRWIGGVHLDSKTGSVWCRRDGRLVEGLWGG